MNQSRINNVMQACREVFRNPPYVIIALSLSVAAFLFSVWMPNIGLITDVLQTTSAPFGAKLNLAVALLGGIRTNFSFLSASYTVAIAILFGMNIAMIGYYLKRKQTSLRRQEAMAGMGGMASGMLGVGCAACGSFLLSSFLSFAGASGALALLPLRGGEFGILSVILLGFSVALISRKIAEPLVCNLQKP